MNLFFIKMLPQIIIVISIFSLFTIVGYENIAIFCFTLGLYSIIVRNIPVTNNIPLQSLVNTTQVEIDIANTWESY
jgi:hypothetical protein